MTTTWHPSWWNRSHGSAWERIKEAVRRDWEQTKHDLSLTGGHELNQDAADTIKQATGRKAIPFRDRPNPPRVIASLGEAEVPLGYRYGPCRKYGAEPPTPDDTLETTLRSEWDSSKARSAQAWGDLKSWVRQGHERK